MLSTVSFFYGSCEKQESCTVLGSHVIENYLESFSSGSAVSIDFDPSMIVRCSYCCCIGSCCCCGGGSS